MRWENLFADLEGQWAAEETVDLDAEVADRSRAEAARITLVDRLRGSCGARVSVRVPAIGVLEGVLREVGSAWLLLQEDGRREALVPLASVLAVAGLEAGSAPAGSGGRVAARLGLTSALRAVARDRSAVSLHLHDASVVTGTVDRVGADFLEVGPALGDWTPGRGEAGSKRVVPLAAVVVLRRQA